MIRPASDLYMRLRPDRQSKSPEQLITDDRMRVVNRLRDLIYEAWPAEPSSNPVASAVLAFAKCLEQEVRDAGGGK